MADACVFIAGHGRMVMGDKTETVPARISVGWAVPEKCSSRPQVSRNMIAGRNGLLTDVAGAGERYNEHWLVPDGAENMVLKAKDLVNALAGKKGYEGTRTLSADTYWLLQPRSKNAVKLSAILAYLLVKIPGPGQIDVMWTCCRSPIGHKGLWSANIHRPWDKYEITTKTEAAVADIISAPGEGKRTSEDKDFDEATWAVKHNCADGTVNLVNASNTSAMLNYASWPGFKGILTTGRMDFLMERKLPE